MPDMISNHVVLNLSLSCYNSSAEMSQYLALLGQKSTDKSIHIHLSSLISERSFWMKISWVSRNEESELAITDPSYIFATMGKSISFKINWYDQASTVWSRSLTTTRQQGHTYTAEVSAVFVPLATKVLAAKWLWLRALSDSLTFTTSIQYLLGNKVNFYLWTYYCIAHFIAL